MKNSLVHVKLVMKWVDSLTYLKNHQIVEIILNKILKSLIYYRLYIYKISKNMKFVTSLTISFKIENIYIY